MWYLAWKDIYLQKFKLLWWLVFASFVAGALLSIDGLGFMPVVFIFTFMAAYSFTIQTCYYEDKNNSITFLRSLPVPAGELVSGRFLALGLVAGVALLVSLGALLIFQLVTPAGFDWSSVVAWSLSAGIVIVLLNCLMVFIYFRWGYARAQLVYAATYIIIFLGGMVAAIVFPGLPGIIDGFSGLQVLIAVLLLAAVLLPFFWYGSVCALNKSDLP